MDVQAMQSMDWLFKKERIYLLAQFWQQVNTKTEDKETNIFFNTKCTSHCYNDRGLNGRGKKRVEKKPLAQKHRQTLRPSCMWFAGRRDREGKGAGPNGSLTHDQTLQNRSHFIVIRCIYDRHPKHQ